MTTEHHARPGQQPEQPEQPVRLRDIDTGEVHIVAVRKRRVHTQPFAMLYQDALLQLVCNRALQGALRPADRDTLTYLIAVCTFKNRVEKFISEIAEDLGHDRSTISGSLKRLTQQDLIQTISDRHGYPRVMLLHPALVFRGNVGQREAEFLDHWDDRPWQHG